MLATPFMIDSLLVAAWYRRSPAVAKQMALISAEVLAVTAAIQGIATVIARRERPYVRICGNERPISTRDCNTFNKEMSFFSGHTALTFAAASVSCLQHIKLELYGGKRDTAHCAAVFTMAGVTGLLRVMGDMHYLSDVAVGAAVGLTVGIALPWFLHYRGGVRSGGVASRLLMPINSRDITLRIVPGPTGASAVGTF